MWSFLTQEIGLDPKNLHVSCFAGNEEFKIPKDTESALLWQSLFAGAGMEVMIGENPAKDGLREGEHIFYYDEKNWWSRAGAHRNMPVGEPGGPDSEMFWDFGTTLQLHENSPWSDEVCHLQCDCGRFMEIGNNVFMEYVRTEAGFEKLAQQNVDFGGGLERLMAASQNEPDMFKCDIFQDIRQTLERFTQKTYGDDDTETYAFRVVMDHVRASVFLIADGVTPSNTDQGYVLRRLLRRAVRYADNLALPAGKFTELVAAVIATYENVYPELSAKQEEIKGIISEEENKFRQTLDKGLREFEKRMSVGTLTAADAFVLFSSYGFPFEITQELAAERGITLENTEYEEEILKHQDLSRSASAGKFKGGLADNSAIVTAYHTATHLMLAALRKELGEDVHQAGSNITDERTRFDFTYPVKVERDILDRVEASVNAAIQAGAEMKTVVMDKEEAKAQGVEGSFWDKYPESVTVYEFTGPDGTVYSQELCGGPHVENTTLIQEFGVFKITKEEASSRGVRRIKAVFLKA
jgi:alanyl-tRNA synthetase